MFTVSAQSFIAHTPVIKRRKLKCHEGGITNTMSIKDLEAINICDQIRDRLMKEDRPLDDCLRKY